MTQTNEKALGVLSIFDEGVMTLKITATTNGHRASTIKHTLELLRPAVVEEVFEIAEQCGFGRNGTLVVMDGICSVFRSSVRGGYEILEHTYAGGTPLDKYLMHLTNPALHPEAKPDDEVVATTMSFWRSFPTPER